MNTFLSNLFPFLLLGIVAFFIILDVANTVTSSKDEPWWAKFLIATVIIIIIGAIEIYTSTNL